MKRLFYLIFGSLMCLIGIIGIFLPVLPTTPFLIVASLCFVKSSQKALDFLYHNRFCGPYIQNYHRGCGVSKEDKRKAFITLTISMSISIYFIELFWVRILLLVIYAGVCLHIYLMKTKDPQQIKVKNNME